MEKRVKKKVAVICPTYNAGDLWDNWIQQISIQSVIPDEILIVDSGSSDSTVYKAKDKGLKVIEISNVDFNHGGTRNLGVQSVDKNTDIVIFLTQDALLANKDSLLEILKPFEDDRVAGVCGRQLPHKRSKPLEAHARIFNYPSVSKVKTRCDISSLGIKTAFMSNSFAAYRYTHFKQVGGFPNDTIFAEDMCIAARMILADLKIVYWADAMVHHSHSYSVLEEFRRYFDVGIFYNRQKWISREFGHASGEGFKFVLSELKYLFKTINIHLLPSAFIRTLVKFTAFKIASIEGILPKKIKKKISMNTKYWT